MKKVYKFKSWIKILFFIVILCVIGGVVGNHYYQDYLYKQSNEYKLLQLGYKEDDVKLFLSKLTNEEQDNLIFREYDEFIPFFVKCNYFLYDKLDLYLGQVIKKEQDFFKYHGTDGYDYNQLVSIVNSHANEEPYSNNRMSDLTKGVAMIANKHYQLGDYAPDDLVAIDWKYRYGLQNDKYLVRKEVYDAYVEMWEAAHNEGIYLLALSSYRSKPEQQSEYDYYKNLRGESYADSVAARPGWSEHQTGLALDIYSKECNDAKTFDQSNTFKWLSENSYKYGFILRYPKGAEKITGYHYESWHYRYLGKDLAQKVHDAGITYDEYYAYYLDENKEE
jgi:D-alanyl-D-alanine carboxypeptidase